jgi:uncharacterized membrane protein YvbJ
MNELIHCPVCGKECSPQAASCPQCGQPLNRQPSSASYQAPTVDSQDVMSLPPKTWLVESILATVLCCLLGIVGIIYAAKVESLWSQGRKAEAIEASKMAKTWTIVSAILGASFIVIYLALMMFGVIAGIM